MLRYPFMVKTSKAVATISLAPKTGESLVPSSKVGSIKKEFVWRKIKVLVISTSGIFLLNVFRIVFLLYFNFKGIPFDIIHESLFFLSAVIGALFFFILLEHWLPELFISIYYLYRLISQKITKKWK